MSVIFRRLILEIFVAPSKGLSETFLFSIGFLLLAASGQARQESQDVNPRPHEIEEELLVTTHPLGKPGGRLVAALRGEPKTLNPVLATTDASHAVIRRLMADLIHINRFSQETENALARSSTVSEDGSRYTVRLRQGIRFSDGHPFDADDVLFTFQVHLDEAIGSPNRALLIVDGHPIKVRKTDQHTVEFEFAGPYAVGTRLFDSLAILPRHRLENSYKEGDLKKVWSLNEPPENVVGLGPYRFKEYVPGERCVLERNPFYWKKDSAGSRLPYFDELVFLFSAGDDGQLVRFLAGDTDVIDRLSAEDFRSISSRRGGEFKLFDLGPGLTYDFMFFNQNELADSKLAAKQTWFRNRDFRRAVSLAVDRASIVRLVFKGRASPLWSNVTPGLKRWVNSEIAQPARSITSARDVLKTAGFSWDERQRLIDAASQEVEFSIITSSNNSQRLQMATIIQSDLQELGIRAHVVPLEHRALVERITQSLDYEACVLTLASGDADPNSQMPLLLSSGGLHLWNLGQAKPATHWEAEIDRLMKAQLLMIDAVQRKQAFDSVQEIMAENVPLVFLTSSHVLVGARQDLGNFNPAVLDHPTLWNVEQLFRQDQGRSRR